MSSKVGNYYVVEEQVILYWISRVNLAIGKWGWSSMDTLSEWTQKQWMKKCWQYTTCRAKMGTQKKNAGSQRSLREWPPCGVMVSGLIYKSKDDELNDRLNG